MNFDYSRWEKQAAVAAEPHLKLVPDIRSKLSELDSHLLEAIAQAAIEELDERDEPDLEDSDEDHCLAGDDGCGRFMGGHLGGVHWSRALAMELSFAWQCTDRQYSAKTVRNPTWRLRAPLSSRATADTHTNCYRSDQWTIWKHWIFQIGCTRLPERRNYPRRVASATSEDET